jgi:hypothetical protein
VKIFYSWQMDAPRKTNKDFIYSALSEAIARIADGSDISEAERDRIELDQDTKGVLGSPEISRVIFEKISASRVMIADVSLVARSHEKLQINSNVAIELGFAYGKIGDGSVLKIMNTYYGQPEELPFDLRIRRHPVQYKLAPDANTDVIAAERRRLAGQLTEILRGYLADVAQTEQIAHTETPFLDLRGRYWNGKEALIPRDETRKASSDVFWDGRSVLYFRCIPLFELPELSAREAKDFAIDLVPFLSANGYSRRRNKWGIISCDLSNAGKNIIGATQLFKNREIWGIDATYCEAKTILNDGQESIRYIPTEALQRNYPSAIDSIRHIAKKLGYGDQYLIEIGLSGAEGTFLAISRDYDNSFPGPFFDREVYIRKKISDNYHTMQIMNDFWEKLFSEVGRDVPKELIWKPDG